MKQKLDLAPGVIFDKEAHTYFYEGKTLSGITKMISKRMGRKMPEEFVGEARNEGLHIHEAIEDWLNGGEWGTIHPGAMWVKWFVEQAYKKPQETCHAEVLVSDLKEFASSVDIIGVNEETGEFHLYDIKRSFNRPYVTYQLSIYKYFIEMYTKYRVAGCSCIAVRDKTVYPVFPYSLKNVEEVLYVPAE